MIDFAIDKLLYLASSLCSARHPEQNASSWWWPILFISRLLGPTSSVFRL